MEFDLTLPIHSVQALMSKYFSAYDLPFENGSVISA